MLDFQTKLSNYADIILKIGVHLQPGQTLIVNANIDTADLTRLVVKKAYELGAAQVKVFWADDVVARYKYDLAPDEAFLEEPTWSAAEKIALVEKGAASVTISSSDPDLLRGVAKDRIVNSEKASRKALTKYREYVQAFKFSWCLATAPSQGWAAKVFPDAPQEEQVDLLWDAIFRMVRADQPDPIAAWEKHLGELKRRAEFLNNKAYKKLHYKSEGTDLTIELPDKHVWLGGRKTNDQGIAFVPNIPTEEVYTAPLATGVSGTVRSKKPLSYGGNIIDNFSFTFDKGRIVGWTAEQGAETLQGLVEMDEGSHYLGEVALVPFDSPISNTNLLFYKTIFDENASCHLAIGSAYAACIEGGSKMTREELSARGINSSLAHTDFMVGSKDLSITGITADGKEEAVFVDGNWAI
ncbi:aminopeptidase [Paenibacillus phyllosphaerae]|uniref:Aminopeptidase n=1 Tax=Paenibacillus phyllosphaerae TaxID=274593 RepID=A0A7W5AT57_9BACL|nr:aminopeptidase [Paenibacillus phyllosphaerae]MBB3108320.1 aminopeptidase [Paenibacillus phyllosphaerae]